MTFEVLVGYSNGDKEERMMFRDVAEIIADNGVYLLFDENMHTLFTAPFDSVVYIAQVPSPPDN